MEFLMYLGLFIVSLAVLLKASDWFIDAAELIGLSFGISPYIIGVTIIAFGTSLPELATSIASVYAGESSIVVGNVVGSNITNILLILGVVAVLVKGGIRMEGQMIMEIDMPLLVCSAFLLMFCLGDGNLSYLEAALLMIGLGIFLVNSMKAGKTSEDSRPKTTWRTYAMVVVGGLFVYLGADYTILSISKLSSIVGIPSEIIALSMVSLGTSLPELVVSVSAARKGKTSMAVGNVMGSNIFNTYAVMAIPRFMGDLEIP
ncbi:MAG: calcium/sodium antiporter, partial [Saprospiraceae bacterium]|nr:calcium/sodium antiporter [Saprospiraceae bacterium]